MVKVRPAPSSVADSAGSWSSEIGARPIWPRQRLMFSSSGFWAAARTMIEQSASPCSLRVVKLPRRMPPSGLAAQWSGAAQMIESPIPASGPISPVLIPVIEASLIGSPRVFCSSIAMEIP